LVNPENGAGGVGGVLECPVLQEEKVVDLFIGGVDGQAACGDVRVVLKKNLKVEAKPPKKYERCNCN
jgi:hypothetical protein